MDAHVRPSGSSSSLSAFASTSAPASAAPPPPPTAAAQAGASTSTSGLTRRIASGSQTTSTTTTTSSWGLVDGPLAAYGANAGSSSSWTGQARTNHHHLLLFDHDDEDENAASNSSNGAGQDSHAALLDVTRPHLRKLASDASNAAAGPSSFTAGGTTTTNPAATARRRQQSAGARPSIKGKKRLSDEDAAALPSPAAEQEREVIMHDVQPGETLASVALLYGIAPHALRTCNRLWPTDPIWVRKQLTVPLDLCNLPSSTRIERVARADQGGSLVIWERTDASTASRSNKQQYQPASIPYQFGRNGTSNSSAPSLARGPSSTTAASARTSFDGFASSSADERDSRTGAGSGSGTGTGRPSLDFPSQGFSTRPFALNAAAGGRSAKGKDRLVDIDAWSESSRESAALAAAAGTDTVSQYLSTTRNPFDHDDDDDDDDLILREGDHRHLRETATRPSGALLDPSDADFFAHLDLNDRRASGSRHDSDSRAEIDRGASSSDGAGSAAMPATTTKRTLPIARVPAMSLSFFPPPTPAFASNMPSPRPGSPAIGNSAVSSPKRGSLKHAATPPQPQHGAGPWRDSLSASPRLSTAANRRDVSYDSYFADAVDDRLTRAQAQQQLDRQRPRQRDHQPSLLDLHVDSPSANGGFSRASYFDDDNDDEHGPSGQGRPGTLDRRPSGASTRTARQYAASSSAAPANAATRPTTSPPRKQQRHAGPFVQELRKPSSNSLRSTGTSSGATGKRRPSALELASAFINGNMPRLGGGGGGAGEQGASGERRKDDRLAVYRAAAAANAAEQEPPETAKPRVPWTRKWDLTYFGDESEMF